MWCGRVPRQEMGLMSVHQTLPQSSTHSFLLPTEEYISGDILRRVSREYTLGVDWYLDQGAA